MSPRHAAALRQESTYRTGGKCRRGHANPLRYVASGECVECQKFMRALRNRRPIAPANREESHA